MIVWGFVLDVKNTQNLLRRKNEEIRQTKEEVDKLKKDYQELLDKYIELIEKLQWKTYL